MDNGNVTRGFWFMACFPLILWGLAAMVQPATAASPTTTFGVSLTISAACTITTGSIASSVHGVPSSGLVVATCTDPSPYNVKVDPAALSPAMVTNRLMNGLYQVTVSF